MSGRDDIGGTIEDFDIGEQLGKGGFATVFRARCLNTGRDVAIKKINKSQITAGGLISRVRQEVTIHSHLSHPSILQLFTFFEDHHYVYLVLELCAKGELQKHLKGLGRVLTEGEAREYLRQIVDGMLYLHSKSIIHRDLTLSNILLDGHEQVKIADFGLATQLQRPDDRHTTMCGTPNYISPEVVTRSSHGLESDVWSLGCMLFIMLVGHPPFDAKGLKESIFTKVVMGDYKVPSYVSAEARSLIAECLQKNPKERIKLSQVPYHSFMTTRSKTDTSRVSDSGLYTMTTVATTHHTRAPLTVISESEVSHSERGSRPEGQRTTSTHSEPYFRHPPSPPVRMKSSPRDLLPPNAGIIDNLKRKFTPLPSMRREDYAFPAPPPPPPARRERDISEEWHKRQQHHQQASDLRYSSSSSCDDKSSCHSGSAPQWGPRGTSNQTRTKTKEHSEVRQRVTGSPKKSRTLKRSTHMRESDMSGAHASDQPPESNQSSGEFARERYSIHQSHSFDGSQNSGYSENLDRGRGRESRNLMRLADHYQCDESQYGHIRPNQRPRSESRSHDYSHSRHGGTARGVPTHHRSRSLEKYRVTDDCRKREPEQHSARDRSREAFRDRTHSCCQSSHHRSSCDRGAQEALGMVSSVSCNSRHRGTDSRGWNTDREAHSSGHSQVSGSIHHKGARLHSKTQTTGSNNDSHGNMLSDIPAPPHTTPANASGDSKTSSSTQRPANPQGPVTPSKSSTAAQTLRQQVSPLSSRRLKKVRYRSNKYFLNILENGEVCLEHLSVRRNQEVVDDVCRISPDGLRIVIYRPNGGLGSAPGEAPPPLPDEGVDLIFSYENLPSKYWTKYKAAARFVKLLRSRTTKITYYSDQAKFYLMENSPDPDFVGQFYQGTKITQSSSNVVVVEGTGTSHTVPRSSAPTALPHHLQSLHFHFKQVYDHCLCLERVLDDLAHKTELGCFPTTMGTKPPSATASPPMSSRGRGYHLCDKENLSPSSLQSFKSPRNIVSQLGSFEASIASVQVGPPLGDPPAPRAPLTPHNAQPLPQHPQKASPFRVYVQNIGWASKGSNGEVSVEYLDGSRVQVSSNSPKVVFMEASGTSTTYSVKDNLPLSLKEKLAQMETVLSCLTQSSTPKASHSSLR